MFWGGSRYLRSMAACIATGLVTLALLLPTRLYSDRFCRSENGGSGLGFSICKTIIEEHGSEIHIKRKTGRGIKVWFILPVKEETDHEGDRNDSFGGGR